MKKLFLFSFNVAVQGRRKVENSGGASDIRPWAAWTFGQTTTLLNLEKSGGASGPPCPHGSGGPAIDAVSKW